VRVCRVGEFSTRTALEGTFTQVLHSVFSSDGADFELWPATAKNRMQATRRGVSLF